MIMLAPRNNEDTLIEEILTTSSGEELDHQILNIAMKLAEKMFLKMKRMRPRKRPKKKKQREKKSKKTKKRSRSTTTTTWLNSGV
jgi:predicted RNA-binding protein with RPS1 domain